MTMTMTMLRCAQVLGNFDMRRSPTPSQEAALAFAESMRLGAKYVSGKRYERVTSGAAVRAARGNVTQAELAKFSGTFQSVISEIETGARPLLPGDAERIGGVLSVEPGELLFPEWRRMASPGTGS